MVNTHHVKSIFTSWMSKRCFCNSVRSSSIDSIQSFASDRDPKLAEEMPVYQHLGKNRHKNRVNVVHACGLNATGALGLLSRTKKKQHLSVSTYPHRVQLGHLKITSAACGYGYTVLGSQSKDMIKVYGMGINTESQLGYHRSRKKDDDTDDNVYCDFIMEPSPIGIPFENYKNTKVTQVACGRAHTLVLTDKEGIYTFGSNAYGQCGRKIIEGEIFQGNRKINHIPHEHFSSPVSHVSCGMDHSLFLTRDGKVYSCGWGADGQTGLGHYDKTDVPKEVTGDLQGVRVKKVATFADMSLAVCDDGYIYGWGNSEYYQLGSVTNESQVHAPTRLHFENIGKVIDAAAGGTICCLLNDNGEVWVWGYGVLGKGPDLKDTKFPEKIPMTLFGQNAFNPNVKVTKVRCGMHHFAAINNKSELFTWGINTSGSLGVSSYRNRYFPWKVLMPNPVSDVFCGVDHTIIFSRVII